MDLNHADAPSHPPSGVKARFSERLKSAIDRKGWTASEAARQVSRFLDEEDKFGRVHMWHYLHGRTLPKDKYLLALSRALDVDPRELLPTRPGPLEDRPALLLDGRMSGPADERSDMVHVRDHGDGTALLQVSQRVAWQTALAVVQILKATHRSGAEPRN